MPLLRSPLTALKLHVCSILSDEDLSDEEDEESAETGRSTRLIHPLEALLPTLENLIIAGDVDEVGFFFGCLASPIGIDLCLECSTKTFRFSQITAHIACMVHEALASAIGTGLAFQDLHVKFGHNSEHGRLGDNCVQCAAFFTRARAGVGAHDTHAPRDDAQAAGVAL